MARSTFSEAEVEEARKALRKWLKPGSTVYTVLRHVSSSGMTRRIDLYTIIKDERGMHLQYLSGYAGKLLGLKRHPRKEGLTVGGCGMDMGFHLVYELSHALFPKGFVPAKARPKMHGRNASPATEHDQDGGYALRHQWI